MSPAAVSFFPVCPLLMPGFKLLPLVLVLAWCAGGVGCATSRPPPASSNPIFVRANNSDYVWDRTVDVVHDYFDIARENRAVGSQPGVIETRYKVGSSILEPWHTDSQGLEARTESTLQSIRRRAIVNVTPAEGGYLIAVEVVKELEDVPSATGNTASAATFQQTNPLRRDLDLVVEQSAPQGWILLGRDELLESAILRSMQGAFP
ncbi:MAG: hypothetical protein ACK5WR_09695 [Planctomycetaceae bacterium]